jgi:glycine oxidase
MQTITNIHKESRREGENTLKCSADVLIVGVGIIGCSIAYFLRKQGAEVIVLEKGDIGAQASSAAAGLLAPIRPLCQRDPFKALQLAGLARFSSFVPELEASSGITVDYEQTGMLRLLPAEKLDAVQAWAEVWQRAGFRTEVLTPEEAYAREPLLSSGLHSAITIADEAHVVPVQVVQAYTHAALNLGAHLYTHTEVVTIQQAETGKRITGVRTDQGDLLTCDQLIIAVRAWSARCGIWLGVTLPVRPVLGELITLQQPSPPVVISFLMKISILCPNPMEPLWLVPAKGMSDLISRFRQGECCTCLRSPPNFSLLSHTAPFTACGQACAQKPPIRALC